MRTVILYVFLSSLLACTTSKKKSTFDPSNLESYFINIRADKDTIIRTPKGAAIRIQKGTFSSDQELEIKEAYTMKDILLAGLATESNGSPLRSGGMIYLSTKEGSKVTLQKPITVLLPTNGVEESMELFKGEVRGDSVNWIKTDTLQPTVNETMINSGKSLYVANCLTCHNINKTLTGPALNNVQARGPWKDFGNLVRWVRNPRGFIPKTEYTKQLAAQFSGQIMPSFPQLAEYDIACVMAFLQNESQKMITDTFQLPSWVRNQQAEILNQTSLTEGSDTSKSLLIAGKPCRDTSYFTERDTLGLSDNTVNYFLNDTLPQPDTTLGNPEMYQDFRNGFTDEVVSDGAYRFEIKTLGWYNVDAYVAGLPGTSLCNLKVILNGEGASQSMQVYAFFPQQKNLSVGLPHGGNEFGFEKVKGKIPLYLGEKGIIIAFGNDRNQFYFGTVQFIIKASQTITVVLKAETGEQLLNAIKLENIEGINMDIVRQKMVINPCAGDSISKDALR